MGREIVALSRRQFEVFRQLRILEVIDTEGMHYRTYRALVDCGLAAERASGSIWISEVGRRAKLMSHYHVMIEGGA